MTSRHSNYANQFRAWWFGVKDGFDSPSCLIMGMSWEDDENTGRFDKNTLYDHGVNFGQRIGAFVKRVPLDD